jgi:hypothetical protein
MVNAQQSTDLGFLLAPLKSIVPARGAKKCSGLTGIPAFLIALEIASKEMENIDAQWERK